MPVVPYYQGRPASTWITAMSGPARAAAANPADDTSPASQQRRVGRRAKDTGGKQRSRSRVRQRLGSLGKQLAATSSHRGGRDQA
jgi:hypothetical protein